MCHVSDGAAELPAAGGVAARRVGLALRGRRRRPRLPLRGSRAAAARGAVLAGASPRRDEARLHRPARIAGAAPGGEAWTLDARGAEDARGALRGVGAAEDWCSSSDGRLWQNREQDPC